MYKNPPKKLYKTMKMTYAPTKYVQIIDFFRYVWYKYIEKQVISFFILPFSRCVMPQRTGSLLLWDFALTFVHKRRLFICILPIKMPNMGANCSIYTKIRGEILHLEQRIYERKALQNPLSCCIIIFRCKLHITARIFAGNMTNITK